jgi:xanthine/uracil/vitamin C permease (AzgA family)
MTEPTHSPEQGTGGRRWPRALLAVVPLLLVGVTAHHPTRHRQHVFAVLAPHSGRWLAVHYLQLVLLPLAGMVLLALLGRERSLAATMARVAIYIFVVYYSVFDGIAGLAVGTLVRRGATLPPAESAVISDAAQALFADRVLGGLGAVGGFASAAWLIACAATARVARRRGVTWVAVIALLVAGVLLAITHTPPLGPLAFAALTACVLLWREP